MYVFHIIQEPFSYCLLTLLDAVNGRNTVPPYEKRNEKGHENQTCRHIEVFIFITSFFVPIESHYSILRGFVI